MIGIIVVMDSVNAPFAMENFQIHLWLASIGLVSSSKFEAMGLVHEQR
jgi:hypothetical protein